MSISISFKVDACPFCKNNDQAMFSIPYDSRFGNKLKYVECMICHAHGPYAASEEEAITSWNARGVVDEQKLS